MKPETYNALLKDLQKLQKSLVASQVEVVRRDADLAARVGRLHAEAEVGGRFDDFAATVARKSTVLFLLRTVFVRVLEDLDILTVKRIRGDWGFAAFREVAPALGLRSYFAFVFRDLAADFPALFAAGDDELPLPDEDGCRTVWQLWHHPNRDGEHYVWNGDGFDSRFLGDLYQDLDADIRKRYALLQTPRFVEEYILDHTLTPALAEFDPGKLRAEKKTFRLLDPTCGSGHFVIGGFHRLADYWRDKHGLTEWDACGRALESVWGADINEHAVEIAGFRLLLEVVARTGVKDLERLAKLKVHLRALDSLIPWERAAKQGDLFPAKDRLDTYATPKQRRENAAFLGTDFHVVVGNPPYITPKDVRKREDYRAFWPSSAWSKYTLSAPFTERFVRLGSNGAFFGLINANNFCTKEFGKPLIEKVLGAIDLTMVVDTKHAPIPGHGLDGGVATVIIFGRHRAPTTSSVRAILGKRGGRHHGSPEASPVWLSISQAPAFPSDESPYVTVAPMPRGVFSTHPWGLGGGFAQEIISTLEGVAQQTLGGRVTFGFLTKPVEDDIYVPAPSWMRRLPGYPTVPMVEGDRVRDWTVTQPDDCVYPYTEHHPARPLALDRRDSLYGYLWRYRETLWNRVGSGFIRLRDRAGARFYQFPFFFSEGLAEDLLCTPYKYTHNHFAIAHAGVLFKQTLRVLQVRTTSDIPYLLGWLNTSTACFWIKQKSGGTGQSAEEWMERRDVNQGQLERLPLPAPDGHASELAAEAIAVAKERARHLPGAVLSRNDWTPEGLSAALQHAWQAYSRMTSHLVALQEELDWRAYHLFGFVDAAEAGAPRVVEPLQPGHRPFEIVFARKDDDADADEKSVWWSRHGHDRVTDLPAHYSDVHRTLLQKRIDLIESDPRLALLESPPYKRRWQLANWPAETKKAAECWLLDRLEDLFAPASDHGKPRGPLADAKPYRLEEVVAAWSRDPRVAAVAGVWAGTGLSVDLTLVAEKLLVGNALPDNPHRVYTDEGLRKLAEWKRVWAVQDQEDAWEKAVAEAKARGDAPPKKCLIDPADPSKELDAIPLPPKFEKADFVRAEFFSTRGKLNVPRERFIWFADLNPPRFGWNGWRDRDRAIAQVEAYTLAESDPQQPLPAPSSDDPRRCGVTFGLWESLPDVRRWDALDTHGELVSLAREACRQPRCPCPIVEVWKAKVLHGGAGEDEPRKGKKKPTVSLAERAWVVALLSEGETADAASLWTRHRDKLSRPELFDAPPPEVAALDESRMAVVLDDLVASADLDATGRGKKKRYHLVPRPARV